MALRKGCFMGPAARRAMRALELRLQGRALFTSALVALAALLTYAHLAAAGLCFAPPRLALAADLVSKGAPVAAALAAASVLLPLARRPSRRYLAVLIERSCPALAGSLILLAERHPDLDPGVGQLAAERAEAALAGFPAARAARLEPRSRLGAGVLSAALALGAVLAGVGRGSFLDSLMEVSGLQGAGASRILAVSPGEVELEEGQLLAASCRLAGRRPDWVRLVFEGEGGETTEMQPAGGDRWSASALPSGSRYRVEVSSRGELRASESFRVGVRPRPSATAVGVMSGRVAGARLVLQPGGRSVPAARRADGLLGASFTVRRVGSYSLLMRPEDGEERETARGSVTARRDLPPAASASVRQLADGRLAADYRAAEDYRLGSARMVFTVGGREMAFAVPDVAGRRESQGAVLVPREVLSAAGSSGFRYRLEAADTCEPEANLGVSEELEYTPPRQLAAAGPLFEPPEKMPGPRPRLRPSAGGESAGETTRPMESLYKPKTGDEEPEPESPSDPGGSRPGNSELMAPPGEEPEKRPEPPEKARPGERNEEPGRENPDNPGDGTSGQAPEDPSGTGVRPTPDGEQLTPGGEPGARPGEGRGPGSEDGTDPGGERPPTGAETGMGSERPERVIPGEVNMEPRPGERETPGPDGPPPLHTDWGREDPGGSETSLTPGVVRTPGGTVRPLRPGSGTPAPAGPGLGRDAPVAPQYRRYVNEYLRAMAAGE
ncbi:MAG: hypothetical protein ACYTGB_16880 [Planctomycetota bacterium]|jgi:hypothetical protein